MRCLTSVIGIRKALQVETMMSSTSGASKMSYLFRLYYCCPFKPAFALHTFSLDVVARERDLPRTRPRRLSIHIPFSAAGMPPLCLQSGGKTQSSSQASSGHVLHRGSRSCHGGGSTRRRYRELLSALDAPIDGPSATGLELIDTYSCCRCRCCHCQLHLGGG